MRVDSGKARVNECLKAFSRLNFPTRNSMPPRREARLRAPRAVRALFDARRNRIVIRLTTGVEIASPTTYAHGLGKSGAADQAQIEVTPAGRHLFSQTRRRPLSSGVARRRARFSELNGRSHGADRRQGAHGGEGFGRVGERRARRATEEDAGGVREIAATPNALTKGGGGIGRVRSRPGR